MVNIDSELPPLEVPVALIRQWIKRYGVWIPHRTGANWEMVIAEAARWGQRQGWDARAAQTSTCPHIVSTNYCRLAEQSAQGQGLLSYAVGEAKPLQSWGQGHTLVKTPTPMDESRTASAEAQPEQDLLTRARQELVRYARPAIEPAPDAKARELLNLLLDDLDALIDNSEGVAGLHLNGDIASWESLREGGTFETWLMRMDEARAHLDSTMAQPEQEGPSDAEIDSLVSHALRAYWESRSPFGGPSDGKEVDRIKIRFALARWGRPAIEPAPLAQPEQEGQEVQLNWQPIATAPLDQMILVYRPDHYLPWCSVAPAKYEMDKYAKNPRPYWKSWLACRSKFDDRKYPPTHWMFWPTAPANEEPSQ